MGHKSQGNGNRQIESDEYSVATKRDSSALGHKSRTVAERSYTHKIQRERLLSGFLLAQVLFGCFLIVWSCWYLTSGSSFPATRYYYLDASKIYTLSYFEPLTHRPFLIAAINGGYPLVNNIIRLVTGCMIVLAALLWIVLFYHFRHGHAFFWLTQLGITGAAAASAGLDFHSTVEAYRICSRSSAQARCDGSPSSIGSFSLSEMYCECGTQGYYWALSAVDAIVFFSALLSLVAAISAMVALRRRERGNRPPTPASVGW
jgi:hypothetical protein